MDGLIWVETTGRIMSGLVSLLDKLMRIVDKVNDRVEAQFDT